jgi:hypothetical protein
MPHIARQVVRDAAFPFGVSPDWQLDSRPLVMDGTNNLLAATMLRPNGMICATWVRPAQRSHLP